MDQRLNKRQFLRRMGGLAALAALDRPDGFAQAAPGGGAKNNRIARITATSVAVPCEYRVGSYKRPIRMGGVVAEVETADGLAGHGFSSITNNDVVVAAIRDVAAPALKGQDAIDREAIAAQLSRLLTPRGETGHAVHAISAIDCALWDIAGKRYGEPIWRLLGGARSEVQVYTTCGMNFLSRDELAQVARDVVKSGQRNLKMVVASGANNLDRSGKSIEDILAEDALRVRAVREAAGPDAQVNIDANQSLDEFQARYFARQIASYDIGFFEEPLRANDIHSMADLRREIAMPIAAGQNEGKLSRWRDMAENEAVDILQMNVCMAGGFTAGLKIAALAQAFNLPIYNAGAYAIFNMHLHAGVANGGLCEWHLNAVPMCRILYKGVPELTRGDRLMLPSKPGLGFDLNRDALKDFAVKPRSGTPVA
ncbi:MAG TPA: mandelate racemase/muconate lactonizing enzyme family protein [Bryobacteraceae bacterium]|nr:mandelate racemase/muconate lactonizing enzyme family protein [Bryobacteraceae bacterium]